MASLIYVAQLALYTAVMWGLYCLVLRNRPLHTYSRMYLLASLAVPAILPLIHIPAGSLPGLPAVYRVALPEIRIGTGRSVASAQGFAWLSLLPWIYGAGSVLLAALYACAYYRIYQQLRKGVWVKHPGYTVITETSIGPGTLGRLVFFPAGEVNPLILRHELGHIQAGHRYDAFLVQLTRLLFWASPAHWLIGKELKTIHEFEADRIASEGIATVDYAALLLSQSFGVPRAFPIAHSFFHHPLKRRIMMLQKTKTPKSSIFLLTAIVLTTGFMSTALLAQTKKPIRKAAAKQQAAAIIDMDVVRMNQPPRNGEVSLLENGIIAFKTVDEMPAFKGNYWKWLGSNLRYTETGSKTNCVVQFTINCAGQIESPQLLRSSGDSKLDEEALRVIGAMPDWKPGLQKGRPVNVIVTQSVYFEKNQEGC